MTKSSAGRSLARLEAAAGAALIERSTRDLRLTGAGRLLQGHARRILDDGGEAENALPGLVGVPRSTPATPDDLRAHGLIGRVNRRATWRFRAPGGRIQEVEVVPGRVIPEPAVLRTVLIGGAGVGRLPAFHAEDAVAEGTPVRLLPEYGDDAVEVHALCPSHRSLSAKVRVFIDALTEHLDHGA